MTRTVFSASLFLSTSLIAQTIPLLPGKIEPGAKDTSYFVCAVSPINDNPQSLSLYGQKKNLWTQAVKGGKFELVSPTSVRVMAPTADAARNDIYAFYQKYAAAAYVRSPLYDSKGNKNIEYVVSKCEPDSTRATNVTIATVSKDKFVTLDSDLDHFSFSVKQLKTPLDDEKLAYIFDTSGLPTDVFERKEQITRRAAKAREVVQNASNTKFVKISGFIKMKPYSFESNSFSLEGLQGAVEAYGYSFKPQSQGQNRSYLNLPKYDMTIPASMMAYKPSSTDEAKIIEKERAVGELKLNSYIQVSDAEFTGGAVKMKGVLSQIDVLNKKGTVLFSLSAK